LKVGGGLKKGKAFEKTVANMLGKWWWGKPFRRSPQSGAWDKFQSDDQHVSPGDIYAPSGAHFPFSVECKKQEKWNLFDLINPKREKPRLHMWLDQCIRDAESAGLEPLLVFSRNYLPIFVIVRGVLIQPLPDSGYFAYFYMGREWFIMEISLFMNNCLMRGSDVGSENTAPSC